MTAPRLEIDLSKIRHNASTLSARLGRRGISVTGVTKACASDIRLIEVLYAAGLRTFGDSRIENIEALRSAGFKGTIGLLRSPMLSQCDRVVAHADFSLNSEPDVALALSRAARSRGVQHGIILMIELGDLREGIMSCDIDRIARQALGLANIDVLGVGTNLGCLNSIIPDAEKMGCLSSIVAGLDETFREITGKPVRLVSGGNSSNLGWALSARTCGRINNLRIGEAILLGVDPMTHAPVHGLHTDAFRFVAEVIEAKSKPVAPWGLSSDRSIPGFFNVRSSNSRWQVILGVGTQDVDAAGLCPSNGEEVLGASSDHLVLATSESFVGVGSEIDFNLNYAALLRAATSPYVTKTFLCGAATSHRPAIGRTLQAEMPA